MPENLCTTVVVLDAAEIGLAAFTVAKPTDLNVEPPRAPVNSANGVAIGECDPVTYFVDDKPVKGSRCLEVDHQGVAYRLSTPKNRSRFQKNNDFRTATGWR